MSKYFRMDSLKDWEQVGPGEMLTFDAPGARRIRLSVMTNADCEVWVHSLPQMVQTETVKEDGSVLEYEDHGDPAFKPVLVAFGCGQFEAEFTVLGNCEVAFLAPNDASIFVRGSAPDHRVQTRDLPKYTTVAPRNRRNSDLDRMMYMMRLNEEQRELRHRKELEALKAMVPAPAPQPAPAPASEPAPAPVPEGGESV